MKAAEIIFLLLASVYPFSYARYNAGKKNYFGAVGMVFLALVAIGFPALLILTR
jgi:hypothetical protein